MPSAAQAVSLKQLREGLEAAVVRQLMTDVPYGVLLSGVCWSHSLILSGAADLLTLVCCDAWAGVMQGLDSSLISAIAARHAAKRVEDEEKTGLYLH